MFFGGERGIRTLGTVLAFTRFPIVRLRPAQPSLHLLDFYIISQKYKKSSPFLKFFLVFFIFFKKIFKNIKKFFKKLLTIEFHCAIISTFRKNECWCGSMAEQLICNQQVVGSTPITSSIFLGDFPSGQRGQTVNLLSLTSVVRIHHPPPEKSTSLKCFFHGHLILHV